MPQLNAFSRQLVALVRQMPDDAILDLVKSHLGLTGGNAPARGAAHAPAAATTAKPNGHTQPKAPEKPSTSPIGDRPALLANIEKFVRASKGVSLGDVVAAVRAPKSRVQNALRDLKNARRIALAGDRRFGRYAADQKTAEAASRLARGVK